MIPSAIAVLGPGLLGGSLAWDLASAGTRDLRVWARRGATLDEAARLGIGGRHTTDLDEAVAGAALVVLATPVGAMPGLAGRIARCAKPPQVVTDMGSVKGMVDEQVAPVLRSAGIAFVGAHPMCGSEKKGIGAASGGLFAGATCILTPQVGERADVLALVRGFWSALGCRLVEMTPAAHDEAVARISHLPHLAAAVLATVAVADRPEILGLAAGGFRDSTRIADGPPEMWVEILQENRDAVAPLVRRMAQQFASAAAALEDGDAAAIELILKAGRAARAALPPPQSTAEADTID